MNYLAILIVDDDPLQRLITSDMLEERGFRSLTSPSGDEALALLQSRADVGIVVTDVVMPGTLDGLGLASEIGRRWPRIRVVVASGRIPAEAAANANDMTFLAKPFGAQELLAALADRPSGAGKELAAGVELS